MLLLCALRSTIPGKWCSIWIPVVTAICSRYSLWFLPILLSRLQYPGRLLPLFTNSPISLWREVSFYFLPEPCLIKSWRSFQQSNKNNQNRQKHSRNNNFKSCSLHISSWGLLGNFPLQACRVFVMQATGFICFVAVLRAHNPIFICREHHVDTITPMAYGTRRINVAFTRALQ